MAGKPTARDVLFMTAAGEYFPYVDMPAHPTSGFRRIALEALARNFYQACGPVGQCSQASFVRFLTGYQPWFDAPGITDGSPTERAEKLVARMETLSTAITFGRMLMKSWTWLK